VRVVTIDGEPWFVATDACRALGLSLIAGSTRHLTNLNQDEVARWRPTDGKVGGRPNAIISESGLYKLVMRSDKPAAKPFQDWVTKVVLPTIRKTGEFSVKATGKPTPKLPFTCAYAGTIRDLKELGGDHDQDRGALPFRLPSGLS